MTNYLISLRRREKASYVVSIILHAAIAHSQGDIRISTFQCRERMCSRLLQEFELARVQRKAQTGELGHSVRLFEVRHDAQR